MSLSSSAEKMPLASESRDLLSVRIQEARRLMGMSQVELAEALGVGMAVVRRLEAGTLAPSEAMAVGLAETLRIRVADLETNAKSIPFLHTASVEDRGEQLREEGDRRFSYGGESYPIELPPYSLNGPPDQRPFHERLLAMQHRDAIDLPWSEYGRRLSLAAVADSEPTAQALLEQPKAKAVSWNSNYGPHGWHRYVGRFPPHLVRALLNGLGANSESLVCDPFAGSGTTLVECRLLGIPAVGIEISPLSALIARTKATFPSEPDPLRDLAADLDAFYDSQAIWSRRREVTHEEVFDRPGNLVPAFANAERWFTPEALLGVSLATEFAASQTGYARDLLLLALSAKMRSIGNVDVDVVRAEYRKEPRKNVDVRRLIGRQIEKMAASVEASVESHHGLLGPPRSVSVYQGNLLEADLEPGSITHVITSPPYGVESLSYLRTHLLSFRSLAPFLGQDPYESGDGVIGSEYLAGGDHALDLSRAERSQRYRDFFSAVDVDALSTPDRKRTAMMMKFFDDLALVGETLRRWLAPGGRVAFVIGNKKLRDQVIPTAEIVCELFAEQGLELETTLRHKLKTNNSNSVVPWQERIISEEYVLVFRHGG